jgi:hypothetical protein
MYYYAWLLGHWTGKKWIEQAWKAHDEDWTITPGFRDKIKTFLFSRLYSLEYQHLRFPSLYLYHSLQIVRFCAEDVKVVDSSAFDNPHLKRGCRAFIMLNFKVMSFNSLTLYISLD